MKYYLSIFFIVISLVVQPIYSIDWGSWTVGGQKVNELPTWDESLIGTQASGNSIMKQAMNNINDTHRLMLLQSGRLGLTLNIHKLFRYSNSDWKAYLAKEPKAVEEQIELGDFLNLQVRKNPKYSDLSKAVDKHFRRLSDLTGKAAWVQDLQSDLAAARMKMSGRVFREYPDFEKFVIANYLHKHVMLHGHSISLNRSGEPMLRVEGEAVPWTEFQDEIELDSKGRIISHFYTYQGFVEGQPDTVIKPFKKVAADTYNGKHIIEIVTVTSFPPHTWIRLINPEGEVYSVGYWGATPLTDLFTAVAHLVPEGGRVTAPDLFEITSSPNLMVETAIAITPEQFENAMEFIEDYQQSPDICYQILSYGESQNCAGFVRTLADELGLNIRTSSWVLPFNNPYSIEDWQKEVGKWRTKELKRLQKNPDTTVEEKLEILYGLPEK